MLKRAILPIAAAILTVLALIPALWNPWWLLIWVVTLPTIALGIYDYTQTRWTITRNYPVAARLRWLFYDLRPFLRAYIVEGNLEGKPFSYETRTLVHARARGENDTHPFGTERDTEAEDYPWLNHSMAPADAPEMTPRVTAVQETCSNT